MISNQELDKEGRVITLEYADFYLINCYTPNTQAELARLAFRLEWEEAFREHIATLQAKKPIILCGDLNVAHQKIDLKNWQSNQKNAGFTLEERQAFTQLLNLGLVDTYRYLNPDTEEQYTWWSYRFKARERNAGWRIDYFCISQSLTAKLQNTILHQEILGSDHCPVELNLDF